MSTSNLRDILENFALVTVMNVCVFKIKEHYTTETLERDNFEHIAKQLNGQVLFLDTLKVSNIKESGPQKVFKAGLKNMPIVRHGKKVELELTDALGKLDTLLYFFGLKQSNILDVIYSDDSFGEPLALEGEMRCVDLKGNVTTLYLFIPCFIPNSNLTLTQDSESNIGIFDLSGELKKMRVLLYGVDEEGVSRNEDIEAYYVIEKEPFFGDTAALTKVPVYHKDTVALLPLTNYNEEAAVTVVFDPDAAIYANDSVDLLDANLT